MVDSDCGIFVAGPSFAVDTACSSSLLALDHALRAIRTGQCEAAVVGGTSLCMHPSTTAQFTKLGMLSPDGACKSFDASGRWQFAVCSLGSKISALWSSWYYSRTGCDGMGMCCEKKMMIG